MESFSLEITLGNDAMDSPWDVAAALRALADRLEANAWGDGTAPIRDANGNTVGSWEVTR